MLYPLTNLVASPDLQQTLISFNACFGIAAELVDISNQNTIASSSRDGYAGFYANLFPPGWRDWQNKAAAGFQMSPSIWRYEGTGGLFMYAQAIRIEDRELAVLYLGPVFHAAPHEDQFRRLAQESGSAEGSVRDVPVLSEQQAGGLMAFLVQSIQQLAKKGLDELHLKERIAASQSRQEEQERAYTSLEARIRERTEELERVNAALQESAERFRVALLDTPVVIYNQDLDLRYTWIYNPKNYAEQPVIGKTDFDLFLPEDANRLTALKRRVLETGLLTREEVSVTVGSQTLFYDMTLDLLHDANGAITGLTCAATDITERKQIEEEIRRRLAESEGIQRIAKGILQKVGLEEVLEIVCTEAMQLTGAKGSVVLLLEQEGWLKLTHRAGSPAYSLDRLPVEGSLAGQAVLTGSPVWVNRQEGEAGEAADQWHGYPWTPGLLSMLSVPLKVDSQTIGVLNILNKPGELMEEDVRIINLFADQAAIIIEHVRLQHRAEKLAILEERQRLARELHDSVTQALYSVTLYADAARMAFSREQWEALDRNLQEARSMAREAMYDMRLLVFELRPFMLEKEGLASALRARLAAVEARAGLQTELLVEGERRLQIGIEEQIFRIIQEGLTNVVKHAKSSRVHIHLRYTEHALRVEIRDDGLGFDPENLSQSGGVGLRDIQERVQQLSGHLEIESAPGKGTRLDVTIPIRAVD